MGKKLLLSNGFEELVKVILKENYGWDRDKAHTIEVEKYTTGLVAFVVQVKEFGVIERHMFMYDIEENKIKSYSGFLDDKYNYNYDYDIDVWLSWMEL